MSVESGSKAAPSPVPPGPQTRLLGRTGLMICEIGFGACAIGGGENAAGRAPGCETTGDAVSLAALQRAFELGINFVDTADVCGNGHCESLVGQATQIAPRRIHVATKVGYVRSDSQSLRQDFSPKHIAEACEQSLERLGVTNLDLYQLHNPPRQVLESGEVWDALRALKDTTRIAHYGVSVSTAQDGIVAIEKGGVESVQVAYNLLDRSAAGELFALAEQKSVGIIARVPLASGFLGGRCAPGHSFPSNDMRSTAYSPAKTEETLRRVEELRFLATPERTLAQAALQFCLAHPAVSVVIPGIKTPAQAEESALAVSVPKLTADDLKKIAALS